MSKIAASGMPITPEGELSAAAAAARANPLDDAAFGAAVAAMRAQLEAWAGRAGGSDLPPLDRSTLLALDIDGTILDINGEVPPRTRAAVVAAAQAGVQVVLATGRGIEAALPVADFLGLTRGWMVCANGALTVRLDPKLKGTVSLPGGYEITNSVTFDPTTAIGRMHQVLPEAIFAGAF